MFLFACHFNTSFLSPNRKRKPLLLFFLVSLCICIAFSVRAYGHFLIWVFSVQSFFLVGFLDLEMWVFLGYVFVFVIYSCDFYLRILMGFVLNFCFRDWFFEAGFSNLEWVLNCNWRMGGMWMFWGVGFLGWLWSLVSKAFVCINGWHSRFTRSSRV